MNLTSLLIDILGAFKQYGKSEHYFECPFCHHHSHKLAINLASYKWHCWNCGEKGNHILFLCKKINVPKHKMKEIREALSEDIKWDYDSITTQSTDLYLPPEFIPLWKPTKSFEYKNALSYLTHRGITGYDIIRYRMGYCESGEYQQRIIIPSYDEDGKLNYFVGRSYYDVTMRYKNPKTSKNVICFEDQVNWELPVVLCEGVFDAISIRRNAIPMLGKYIPKKLEVKLLEKEVSTVYVLLDDDAKTEALALEKKLESYGINVYQVSVNGGDAAELGFAKTWDFINQAKKTTFKDFIQTRLQNI